MLDEWRAEAENEPPDPVPDEVVRRLADRRRSEAFHRLVDARPRGEIRS
jgi:hypothetical protein